MTDLDELIARCERATEERRSGQWDAFNEVLNFLNTIEAKSVEKKTIYAAVMDMRPSPTLSAQVALQALTTPRYLSEWNESVGDVLWWTWPIVEPPYVGTPLDTAFHADFRTWWTPLPNVADIDAAFHDMADRARAKRISDKEAGT